MMRSASRPYKQWRCVGQQGWREAAVSEGHDKQGQERMQGALV